MVIGLTEVEPKGFNLTVCHDNFIFTRQLEVKTVLEWVGTVLMQATPVRLWPDSGTLWMALKKKEEEK